MKANLSRNFLRYFVVLMSGGGKGVEKSKLSSQASSTCFLEGCGWFPQFRISKFPVTSRVKKRFSSESSWVFDFFPFIFVSFPAWESNSTGTDDAILTRKAAARKKEKSSLFFEVFLFVIDIFLRTSVEFYEFSICFAHSILARKNGKSLLFFSFFPTVNLSSYTVLTHNDDDN